MPCVSSRGTQSLAQCHNQQTISELKTNKKAAWKKVTREEETEVLKSIVDKELLTATLVNISKYRSNVLWVTKTTVNTPAESQIHHSQSQQRQNNAAIISPSSSLADLGLAAEQNDWSLHRKHSNIGKEKEPEPVLLSNFLWNVECSTAGGPQEPGLLFLCSWFSCKSQSSFPECLGHHLPVLFYLQIQKKLFLKSVLNLF